MWPQQVLIMARLRLLLRGGQHTWEYGLVIRERWKHIYAAGDTLWVAVAIIYEGQDSGGGFREGARAIQAVSECSEKSQG